MLSDIYTMYYGVHGGTWGYMGVLWGTWGYYGGTMEVHGGTWGYYGVHAIKELLVTVNELYLYTILITVLV